MQSNIFPVRGFQYHYTTFSVSTLSLIYFEKKVFFTKAYYFICNYQKCRTKIVTFKYANAALQQQNSLDCKHFCVITIIVVQVKNAALNFLILTVC